MSTDEAQERRNATWQKLKAESAALMDEVDRILSERRDPNAWENVVKLTPKAKPEPPRKYTDLVVDQMIGAVREETANSTRSAARRGDRRS